MRLRVTVEDITGTPARVAVVEAESVGGFEVNGERVTSFYVRSDSMLLGKCGTRDLSKTGLVRLAATALQTATTAPTQGLTSLEQMVESL